MDVQTTVSDKTTEYHLPFHNYAGPGTNLEKRINQGDVPVTPLDAAALVHDMEYLRDDDRSHADQHMIHNLDKNFLPNNPVSTITDALFKLDAFLGKKRTMNNPIAYHSLKSKAKKLLKIYPLISFDDDDINE